MCKEKDICEDGLESDGHTDHIKEPALVRRQVTISYEQNHDDLKGKETKETETKEDVYALGT